MIQLKGNGDFLRCIIPDVLPEEEVWLELKALLERGEKILCGARVVLDFQGRSLSQDFVKRMLDDFVWPSHMRVDSWISYDAKAQELLSAAGFSTVEPLLNRGEAPFGEALFLRRSLRSGQRIEHRGDVIVLGQVNDGAEIVASGHVVVLGRLQGLVHAGSDGNEEASIIAKAFEATQVRIGHKVGTMERSAAWWGKPVVVTVGGNDVIVAEWPA